MYSGVILIKSAFWMVITVILCYSVCACITDTPSEGSTPSPTIVADKTPRDEPGKIPLEQALGELEGYSPSGSSEGNSRTIHHVHGSGLDLHGNASSWVLGIREGDVHYLLVYSQKEWRQLAWGEPFLSSVLSLNTTILPTGLYEQNREVIVDAMMKGNVTESDIDLADGVYIINIRSNSGIALLKFNSTTGELVSRTG